MAPKAKRGKSEEEWKQEKEMAEMRLTHACFPSTLLMAELVDRLAYMVCGPGNENGVTEILPTALPVADDRFRFFSAFFWSVLVPPFSDFLLCMMEQYGLLVLQLHPNAVAVLAVFAHLCENFVGLAPSVPLFQHFYVPRIEDEFLSGSVTWIFRNSMK